MKRLFVAFVLLVFACPVSAQPLSDEEIEELSKRLSDLAGAVESGVQQSYLAGAAESGVEQSVWPALGIVTSGDAKLYEYPFPNANVLRSLQPKSPVTLVGSHGDFVKAQYENDVGWVELNKIDFKSFEGVSYSETIAASRVSDWIGKALRRINDIQTYLQDKPLRIDGFSIDTTPPNVSVDFKFTEKPNN